MNKYCKFCYDEIPNYIIRDKFGSYCSKVCRIIDLKDSLIEEKENE